MYLKLLIDGIARQTTVLLAQLSTNSGARAPMAQLADQVFLNLTREIEAQGISKAVVADMFGLALRSYQKKTRRLEQSATEVTRTLWEAIYDYIREEDRERHRIIERFRWDGEREVGAVLSDLVASGLIYATGNAQRTVYGATSAKTRRHVQQSSDQEALANVIWLKVFHEEATTTEDLERQLGVDCARIAEALAELSSSDRVVQKNGRLEANNVVIRVGSDGKEAAMLDHFQAVAKVIAKRASATAVDPSEGGRYLRVLHPPRPPLRTRGACPVSRAPHRGGRSVGQGFCAQQVDWIGTLQLRPGDVLSRSIDTTHRARSGHRGRPEGVGVLG